MGLGVAVIAAATLGAASAALAADTAKVGFDDCLGAKQPKLQEVGTKHVLFSYEYHDDCLLPAQTFLQYRVRDNGHWKDWVEFNRERTEFLGGGASGPVWKSVDIRMGDDRVRPNRTYQVRVGVAYVGETDTTEPTTFATEYTPASDLKLRIYQDPVGPYDLRYDVSWKRAPYGTQELDLVLRNGSTGQRLYVDRRTLNRAIRCNEANRCSSNYTLGRVWDPGTRNLSDADMVSGETYVAKAVFTNATYGKGFDTEQQTVNAIWTAGQPTDVTVGDRD
jgi:hypothetical protein